MEKYFRVPYSTCAKHLVMAAFVKTAACQGDDQPLALLRYDGTPSCLQAAFSSSASVGLVSLVFLNTTYIPSTVLFEILIVCYNFPFLLTFH